MKPKVQTTTERKIHFELSRIDVIAIMRKSGLDVPDDAQVAVDVPGGGDWSNTRLDVDQDSPLIVKWTERSTDG